jgi:hypothetical protein
MAAAPIFAATPLLAVGSTAAASAASYTAPTNTAVLITAAASLRVERVRMVFAATTAATAGFACVYVKRSSVYYLLRAVAYTLVTSSATVAPNFSDGSGVVTFEGGLLMNSGDTLEIAFTGGTATLVGTADYATF